MIYILKLNKYKLMTFYGHSKHMLACFHMVTFWGALFMRTTGQQYKVVPRPVRLERNPLCPSKWFQLKALMSLTAVWTGE